MIVVQSVNRSHMNSVCMLGVNLMHYLLPTILFYTCYQYKKLNADSDRGYNRHLSNILSNESVLFLVAFH